MKIGIKNVEFTAWIFKNVYVMALTKVFSTALVPIIPCMIITTYYTLYDYVCDK